MTYEQIVAMMQTYYKDADASNTTGHYAVQFNVTGEGEGAFYLEIAEGKVNVQPFDYVDRNAAVNAAAEILTAITEGKDSYTDAVNGSRITIDGDQNAAAVLDSVKTAVKAAEKKSAAEAEVKAEEKKTAAKAEVRAEEKKPAAKAEVKAEEKKPAAKAEVKAEEKKSAATAEVKAEEKKEAEKAPAKTAAKKAPARKRAVSKAASNAKSGKSTKKAAK